MRVSSLSAGNRSAVYCYDELAPVFSDAVYGFPVKAITLVKSGRDIVCDIVGKRSYHLHHQGC